MTLRETLRWHYKNTPWFRRSVRRTKDEVVYVLVRFVLALVRVLPLGAALWLAEKIGAGAYAILPPVRDASDKNLRLVYGSTLSEAERHRIGRASAVNAARCLVEIAAFDKIRPQVRTYVRVDHPEIAEGLRHTERGSIVVTGHYGNWELLAAYFALGGHDIAAIARRIYVEKLNRLMMDFRASNGVESIVREEKQRSARQMLSVLKRGGVLAIIIDMDTHAQSMSVPFLGHPARTPVAPVALALRRRVPIHAVFIERQAEGGHLIRIGPAIPMPDTGDAERDLRLGLERVNEVFEAQVRRCPEQWVWWTKRWDRGPIPQLDLDADFAYTDRQLTSPPEAADGNACEARG